MTVCGKAVGDAEYFEVVVETGRVILTPVRIQQAAAVRRKLAELEITERDIEDSIAWARRPS